jgi:hypothetical protein
MNSKCRYCDIALFNSKVCRDGVDPTSHNFKEDGKIVCEYYLANVKTQVKPMVKTSVVPHGHTKVPLFKKKESIQIDNSCVDIMRIELNERKKEASIRYSNKLNMMSEAEKIRIAKWMKENTPTGKKIDKQWQPYLSTTINAQRKSK